MPTARTHARTTFVVFCTAALAAGTTLPAAASSRPDAADPTTISAAMSAAKDAAADRRNAIRSRESAEQVLADRKQHLDRAQHGLVATRDRLRRLGASVAEAAEERHEKGNGVLEVAADATGVAADVAGAVAPVVEALNPLAEAVERDLSVQHPTPAPGDAERDLRAARARAIRDHRAAADAVADAQQELDDAAAALAAARDAEQRATTTADAATNKADAFAASLGIDRRLVRPGVGSVSSPYGGRTHPVTGSFKAHTGIDFQAANGLAYAAAEGTVAEVSVDPAYGNLVTIAHGKGVRTRYAHLAAPLVELGVHVSAGQVIGRIGSTGLSTGPHLHFEIQVNGWFRDPARWLGG
jgi:murein DD-endopeptidase MepM/ murein hydrolase activator NlpD